MSELTATANVAVRASKVQALFYIKLPGDLGSDFVAFYVPK
jgi:hypothetical protein